MDVPFSLEPKEPVFWYFIIIVCLGCVIVVGILVRVILCIHTALLRKLAKIRKQEVQFTVQRNLPQIFPGKIVQNAGSIVLLTCDHTAVGVPFISEWFGLPNVA